MEEQIGMHLIAEAGDGRGIDGNTVLKSPLQLLGHDGNILIASVYIAEGKADEFHILLLDILHDFLGRVFHIGNPAFCVLELLAAFGNFPVPEAAGFFWKNYIRRNAACQSAQSKKIFFVQGVDKWP